MSNTCPDCLKDSVIDVTDSECDRVCSDCGAVVSKPCQLVIGSGKGDGAEFVSEKRQHNHLKNRKYADTHESCNKMRKFAFGALADISAHLKLNNSTKEAVEKLLKKIFDERIFTGKQSDFIRAVVVCCIYCICSRERRFFRFQEIADVTKCNVHYFNEILKNLKEKLGVVAERRGIDEIAQQYLEQISFDPKLIKQTQDLLLLLKECWVTDSRNYKNSIIIAAYIVYSANELKNGRKRLVTVTNFERLHKQNTEHGYKVKVKDEYQQPQNKQRIAYLKIMRETLDKLLKELPWPVMNKGKDTVYHYLDDILDYKRTLIHEIRKKHKATDTLSDDQESFSDPFLPPSFKRAKKSPSESTELLVRNLPSDVVSQLDNSILGESSDEFEDVSCYVRNPEEVAGVKLLKTHHQMEDS